MSYADLHVHTTASDGLYTPSEAVRHASEAGLSALGIADHDTFDGIGEALLAGGERGVEIVPGVEVNTDSEGTEVHVLGYYAGPGNERFEQLLRDLRESRQERLSEMVRRLSNLGIIISADRVRELAGEAAPGRLHVARAIVEAGYEQSIARVFALYLSAGRPAYVERYKLTPAQAVRAILDAGGVPVLAHPGLTGRPGIVPPLVDAGLMGLEVYHPDHDEAMENSLLRQACQYGLLITGGSDCHGPGYEHSGAIGEVRLPYTHVQALKARAKARAGNKPLSPLI